MVLADNYRKINILNVSDYGSDSTSRNDNTKAVQLVLEQAKSLSGKVLINFPKGEYHFYKDFAVLRELYTSNTSTMEYPFKKISIIIEDQEDIVIEGNGSKFIFHGDIMAIATIRSHNISFRNFSIDYSDADTVDISVVNQGEKEGSNYTDFFIPCNYNYVISEDRKHIEWLGEKSIISGEPYWRRTDTMNAYLVIFKGYDWTVRRHEELDIDGKKVSDPFRSLNYIEKINENILRFYYYGKRPESQELGNVFLLCDSRIRKTTGVFFWESKDILSEEIDVHYLSGFGWLIQMCENIFFKRMNFVPLKGAGKFTTSNADQIHAVGVKGEIKIMDSNFSMSHDDPINIHGTYMRVEEIINKKTFKIKYVHRQQGGFKQFFSDNEIVFYNRTTLEEYQEIKEQQFFVEKSYGPGEYYEHSILDRRTEIVVLKNELSQAMIHEISKKIIVNDDGEKRQEGLYVVENASFTPKVLVSGCTFQSIPTRAILCTTGQEVSIKNNTFSHISMANIYLSNDAYYWYESGPIKNMLIENNIFDVRDSCQKEWLDAPAIFIDPVLLPNEEISNEKSSFQVHKNIKIKNNEFIISNDSAVISKYVKNIVIEGNILRSRSDRVNEKEVYQFYNSEKISICHNTYDSRLNLKVKDLLNNKQLRLRDISNILEYENLSLTGVNFEWSLEKEPTLVNKTEDTESYFLKVDSEKSEISFVVNTSENLDIKIKDFFTRKEVINNSNKKEEYRGVLELAPAFNYFVISISTKEQVVKELYINIFKELQNSATLDY